MQSNRVHESRGVTSRVAPEAVRDRHRVGRMIKYAN